MYGCWHDKIMSFLGFCLKISVWYMSSSALSISKFGFRLSRIFMNESTITSILLYEIYMNKHMYNKQPAVDDGFEYHQLLLS